MKKTHCSMLSKTSFNQSQIDNKEASEGTVVTSTELNAGMLDETPSLDEYTDPQPTDYGAIPSPQRSPSRPRQPRLCQQPRQLRRHFRKCR